jgi:AraC-like DNA-binding protein
LGIWIHYTRLVGRKNRSLYLRIQELTHIEKEAEEQLLKAPEEKLSRKMQVFRSLSQYMQEKTPFTDPTLNRKMLATYINSNEAYLAEAIREATGETVSSYISGLRLQYALKLLEEHPDITIDAIAIDSGYGSYSPFFRSFAKKYGITPSEYRKMSREKNKKQGNF